MSYNKNNKKLAFFTRIICVFHKFLPIFAVGYTPINFFLTICEQS